MNIQEEILSEFFSKLDKTDKFPTATKNLLKELWEQGNLANKSEILQAIRKGINNDRESEIN